MSFSTSAANLANGSTTQAIGDKAGKAAKLVNKAKEESIFSPEQKAEAMREVSMPLSTEELKELGYEYCGFNDDGKAKYVLKQGKGEVSSLILRDGNTTERFLATHYGSTPQILSYEKDENGDGLSDYTEAYEHNGGTDVWYDTKKVDAQGDGVFEEISNYFYNRTESIIEASTEKLGKNGDSFTVNSKLGEGWDAAFYFPDHHFEIYEDLD